MGFFVILAAAVVGMTHAYLWAVPVGGLALMTISAIQNRVLYARAYYGSEASQGFALATMAASLFNGLVASGAAYTLGAVIGIGIHS